MRTENKKQMVVDPRWDGIDFSSAAFAELDQQITKGLNQVVARHSKFAHSRRLDAIATNRGVVSIDDAPVNKRGN